MKSKTSRIGLLLALLLALAAPALVVGPVPVAQAAAITVNSTADTIADDGQCTLREAIIAANTNTPSGTTAGECAAGDAAPTVDVITFTDLAGSPDLYTLTIAGIGEDAAATGDLDITEELNITGNGQTETIIQAGTDETNGIDRVFEFFADATFEDVTIRHGRATSGYRYGWGGGIYSHAVTVHLTNSTVSGNSATLYGGIHNRKGTMTLTNCIVSDNSAHFSGGIDNHKGTMTLTNSTVSGNSADYGGGIFNGGTMTLTNSTVSGNLGRPGGGIFNGGTMTLTNSTVSGNSATKYWRGGGIFNDEGRMTLTNSTVSGNFGSGGGGIYNHEGSVNLSNTIIADQLAGRDCDGDSPTSNGYNLDSDGRCSLSATGDISSGNANLGPLQVNAPGNTATHALLPGSDAIDTGNCSGGTITSDQRGVSRPQPAGGNCDIGAYEEVVDTTPPEITPNVSGTLGNNGWYVSDVTVSWTVTDPESEVSETSGCDTNHQHRHGRHHADLHGYQRRRDVLGERDHHA